MFRSRRRDFCPERIVTFGNRLEDCFAFFAAVGDLGDSHQPFGLAERRLFEVLADVTERNAHFEQFRLHAACAAHAEQQHQIGPLCEQQFVVDISVEADVRHGFGVCRYIFIRNIVSSRNSYHPVDLSQRIEHRHISRGEANDAPRSRFHDLSGETCRNLFSVADDEERCFGVLGALPRIEYFEKRTLPAFSTDDLEARGIGRFVEGFRIGVYSCRVRCAGDKEGSRAKQDEIDCFFHKNPLKSLFAETGCMVVWQTTHTTNLCDSPVSANRLSKKWRQD